MTIQAGKLRHTIIIQQQQGRDSTGAPTSAWTDFAKDVRASVEPLQGREYLAASGQQAEVTTRFRLRYIPGVTAAMRVVFEGRIFNIVTPIDPNMLHRELLLMTVETDETLEDE